MFRRLAATLLLLPALAAATAAAAQDPEPIVLLGFELVDEQPEPARADEHRRRLAAIGTQLRQGLAQRGLYRVLDNTPAQDEIDRLRSQNEFIYRCNACFGDLGLRLGARLVAVGWVQKVSNLILNINVSVRDAQTDAELLSKSVDLRGNTDETWARGIAFMLRDWQERRARNPRYGLGSP